MLASILGPTSLNIAYSIKDYGEVNMATAELPTIITHQPKMQIHSFPNLSQWFLMIHGDTCGGSRILGLWRVISITSSLVFSCDAQRAEAVRLSHFMFIL